MVCGDGTLRLLGAEDGSPRAAVATGGDVRSPPAAAPWDGTLWLPSHSRRLTVWQPSGAACLPTQRTAILPSASGHLYSRSATAISP